MQSQLLQQEQLVLCNTKWIRNGHQHAIWAPTIQALVGKSAWNSTEFCDYSNLGPFPPWNFDRNFIFPIVKLVPANSEHVPAILEYFPTIDSSNFMHRKRFLPLIIFPPKLHLLVLHHNPSRANRCNFGEVIIFPSIFTSTCFASQSK